MAEAVTPSGSRPAKPNRFSALLRDFFTYEPRRVKPQLVSIFCRQMASFVRVGVPVTTALETFSQQAPNKRMRTTYLAMATDIQRGVRLSDAFAAHPKVFPRIVPDMVRSAENTGNLDVVLRQAGKHIEREASAKSKLKAAMTYPAIIFVIAFLLAIGIVVVVLPAFKDLYKSLGVKTPAILNALLALSDYLKAHGLFIAIGVLIAVVLIGLYVRTEQGRLVVDGIALRIPVIRRLLLASMIEMFCRNLGDMLTAGVPIGQTYSVAVVNVGNRVYRRSLARVGPMLAAGQGLSGPLLSTNVFPPSVIQMFRVGEETGHLDTNLIETADMYEEEIDYRIKRLTAILEPAMVVFVGLVVGFVAVTLITSIYSLAGGFK